MTCNRPVVMVAPAVSNSPANRVPASADASSSNGASHKSKAAGHSQSFAHLLKQGMDKDDNDAPATKQDGQKLTPIVVAPGADESKTAKPPVTLKFGQPVDPAATPKSLPDANGDGQSPDQLVTDNSDSAVLTNGTSILMALLSQAKLTSLNLGNARPVDPKLTNSDPQDPHATAPTLISLAEVQNGTATAAAMVKAPSGDALQGATSAQSLPSSDGGVDPNAGSSAPAAAAATEGHMAFALRISTLDAKPELHKPAGGSSDAGSPASPAAASPATPAFAPDGGDASGPDGGHADQHQPSPQDNNTVAAAVASDNSIPSAIIETGAAPESAASTSAAELDDKEEGSAEPVRNVQMQLVGQGNQRVNISLLDRAGQLRVNVRSTDKSLTQNLQNQMPVLTSRLAAERYLTEVWIPGRNDGDGNQQQAPQQDQPDWVDNPNGVGPGTSERINTSWLLQ